MLSLLSIITTPRFTDPQNTQSTLSIQIDCPLCDNTHRITDISECLLSQGWGVRTLDRHALDCDSVGYTYELGLRYNANISELCVYCKVCKATLSPYYQQNNIHMM
jgi:hypothetical protein